jgi:hypothetical protein
MESEPLESNDDQSQYDVFRRDSTLELSVAEEKPLQGKPVVNSVHSKSGRTVKPIKRTVLVIVLALILLAGIAAGIKFLNKPDKPTEPTTVVINTQSLDNGTLNQLTPTSSGEVKQQLTISPSTIFKNDVAVQGSADITKNLSVGGIVNIQGATNIKDSLSVAKSVNVGTNLTVNGLITAASLSVGSLTISSINLSSDLNFGGHIVPSGSQPAVRASVAAAGGSVSISGNDTAGTITINTGNGSLTAGELAVITFKTAFNATPRVQLTPLNSPASGLRYFATHTAGFFTINTSTAPANGTTYIFDYLVTQ